MLDTTQPQRTCCADHLSILSAQHVHRRADLLASGGKGSVDTVKASAAIRKDLKELEALKMELTHIHQVELQKAIKEARSVRSSCASAPHFRPLSTVPLNSPLSRRRRNRAVRRSSK